MGPTNLEARRSQPLTTKERIIKPLQGLKIPKDELIVVGGAALELFGIKRTNDIDAVVPLPRLLNIADWSSSYARRGIHLHRHEATLFDPSFFPKSRSYDSDYSIACRKMGRLTLLAPPNDEKYQATFEELKVEAVEIGGLLVSPPERILEWKVALDRRKDQADIEKIEKFFESGAEEYKFPVD